MNNQDQPPRASAPKRRGRGLLFWVGGTLVVLLGLLVLGAAYESTTEAAEAQAYPPPGQLVDVGGYRLHLNCTGTSSPTVVVDAGLGDWSTTWGPVQEEVAQATRICTYDRAGSGWSDDGPLPRDAGQFVKELHTLLQRASVPGPYVLVGHSLGGLTVLVYAHEYPSDVAGVVLIDSMSPKQFKSSPSDTTPEAVSPAPAPPFVAWLARFGLVRLAANLPGSGLSGLSYEETYIARFARPQYWQATLLETQGMPSGGAQAKAVQTLGALPLIVLTASLNQLPDWQENQADLVNMSSRGEQLFADRAGHNVHVDQPEAVVGALLRMVEQTRR